MMDSTTAASLAIVAAVILPFGTAISVYFDVKHYQEIEKNKQAEEEATSVVDDEEKGTVEDASVEVSDSSLPRPPVRFPTVSAATARFGSTSYNVFVATTTLHAACSQVFNYWWYNTIQSSSNENASNDGVDVISLLATIGLLVAVVFLWFMSLIPAKGRGTIPHIACGMIYFQAAIAWMVWICMVTNRMKRNSVAVVIVEALLCSFAMLSATWAFVHVHRTMKRYTPGTREWKDSLHKGALGQFSFGITYSVFMIVTAVSSAVA